MSNSPEQVFARIFAAFDDHRYDALRLLYADAVVGDTVVGRVNGVDDVIATLRRIHDPVPHLQHLLSGVVVDANGDEATLRGNVVAVFCDAEHTPVFEGASVWRGVLRRAADGWRVSTFSMTPVWSRGTFPST